MNVKKYTTFAVGLAMISSLAFSAPAFAKEGQGKEGLGFRALLQTNISDELSVDRDQGEHDLDKIEPILVGRVSAVNGDTITVASNKFSIFSNQTFRVDTADALIVRGGATIQASDIAVGDIVIVQGTVDGNSVAATSVRDVRFNKVHDEGKDAKAFLQIQGNGQPVIAGKVTSINNLTITVTNSSDVTYTIDASDAKIAKGKNEVSLSDVEVGDSVIVQGAVNGSNVSASTIIDQNLLIRASANSENQPRPRFLRFFISAGRFFSSLFGF